eukprot:CAMPEP_0171250366 /NCGR_PEP_ID=MMETSP0790-20130122/50062_1 /TAXON_ID=2925 /ORGANISM="Alexandrium catenella, Strain OF101" /LENGTH=44 /DNA_ID= /DNA_START= /DNA_END= /DNA_ORIENTATION=
MTCLAVQTTQGLHCHPSAPLHRRTPKVCACTLAPDSDRNDDRDP